MKKFLLIAFIYFIFSQATYPQSERADFESEIQHILDEYHIPGAAIASIANDTVYHVTTFGYANVESQIPVSEHTQFGIGSISKTFLALAVMHAHENGLLNIYAPLSELVPDLSFTNQWEATHPVRLVHLLEHTSGFDEAHFNLFAQANSKSSFSDVIDLSQKALNTRWKPGKFYAYNNLGYMLAAHVLEEKSGASYENYVKQHILLPLHMENAVFHPAGANPYLAKGYSGGRVGRGI